MHPTTRLLVWKLITCMGLAQALIDDWEFREDPFLEFVGVSLQRLAEQLQGCTDYDAQLKASLLWLLAWCSARCV